MRYGTHDKSDLDALTDSEIIDAIRPRNRHVDPGVMAYLKAERPGVLADHLLDQLNDPAVTVGGPALSWLRSYADSIED